MNDEIRIRAATSVDVPAIAEIVNQAYRHYIVRIGKPPGPMLDDYGARVSEGAVWLRNYSVGQVLARYREIFFAMLSLARQIPESLQAGSGVVRQRRAKI